MNTVYFAKTKPEATIPSKRDEDAGYDFYPCFEEDSMTIGPGEINFIPTGIAAAFDKKYALIIKERSSTGAKGMSVRSGVFDSGYRGEIVISFNNTTKKAIIITKNPENFNEEAFTIHPYSKAIAQGLLVTIPTIASEEISYKELKNIDSERGLGRMGSSGK